MAKEKFLKITLNQEPIKFDGLLIELKRNFIAARIGMLLWQDEATFCEVLRSLLISSRFLSKLHQHHITVILISPYKHCISAKITNI